MKQTSLGFSNGFSILRWAVAAALILSLASVSAAQKNKKNKGLDENATLNATELATPVNQQIDDTVGQMLAAFQLGNVEMMHKCYADSATFVSGDYSPLVVGWANYAPQYSKQMVGFQGLQIVRRNTFIFVHADVAWVSYQWELLATYANQPYASRGKTTLVLNKSGDKWLIVHNHTSESYADAASTPAASGQTAQPTLKN